MRVLVLATLALSGTALAEPPAEYVPAPASEIAGYSEKLLPCEKVKGWKTKSGTIIRADEVTEEKLGAWNFDPGDEPATEYVSCKGEPNLQSKSLRELSLLRNTIFARYGWAGFRKPWLREHFQQQPWYKPDPKFSYKRLSKVDRQNVELIAQAELGLRYADLEKMKEQLLGKAGQWWGDLPSYEGKNGKQVIACDLSAYKGKTHLDRDYGHPEPLAWVEKFEAEAWASKDCTHHGDDGEALKKHRANTPVAPDLGKLSPEERIELGLISRAMGDFAVDEDQREQAAGSLDEVLKVKELRMLSLRDLRLLRNTIFARRGRSFKSELLQEHFQRMPWYTPDPAYSDKRLTKTDKRNIELILQVEKEFGGALQDKDFRVENPSGAGDVDEPVPPALVA
ncbi:YARHG domain-containing protein [Archangium gephyra]|uniref:YARHG domain-containing protein n=1 Tax=Archangium gephyra TaxID=48 RepID=UPI0035D4B6C5